MRRTAGLAATALWGSTLLVPGAASGAGETCRGEPATIVGGGSIRGTEGRDVIVTDRAQHVDALGGDDLICLTGDATLGYGLPVSIDAGPGNDVVDGTGSIYWAESAWLGTGEDLFVGTDHAERVDTGPYSSSETDTERDVVVAGGGDDEVTSGTASLPNRDYVDLGGGDDALLWRTSAWAPEAAVTGGAGADGLSLALAGGDNVLDSPAGELRGGGVAVARWSAMESFVLTAPPAGTAGTAGAVDIVGSGQDESFTTPSGVVVTADLGAGDDSLTATTALQGSRFDGGAGRDRLAAAHPQRLSWDLANAALEVGTAYELPATGFEDAFMQAPRVTLDGTGGPNRLVFNAARVVVRGRGGDDTIEQGEEPAFGPDEIVAEAVTVVGGAGADLFLTGRAPDRLLGGPGRDRAESGGGNDVFLGGPGRDRVDGGRGRDRCVAERENSCER